MRMSKKSNKQVAYIKCRKVKQMERGKVKSETGLNLRLKPNGDRVGVLKYNEEFNIVDEITFSE